MALSEMECGKRQVCSVTHQLDRMMKVAVMLNACTPYLCNFRRTYVSIIYISVLLILIQAL